MGGPSPRAPRDPREAGAAPTGTGTRDGASWPPRTDVVGTPISTTSYAEVLDLIERRPRDLASAFAFCTVHSVMSARGDSALADALAGTDVTTSDGMPLVWALRRLGHPDQQRVYGPDLMEIALPHGVDRGWRHFLFGTTEATLARLRTAAQELAPGVEIVGSHAPPFRPLTTSEEDALVAEIRASGADLVWVGLGMPKQELWIHHIRERLPGVALMGVGAAFDLLAGTIPQAPDWMQQRGLEWLYRLKQEPRRLWRRYLVNNPRFLVLLARQLVAHDGRTRGRA